MISTSAMNTLQTKAKYVNDLFAEYGFNNISIYRPMTHREAGKLHFTGTSIKEKPISLLELSDIEEKLSEMLEVEVAFIPENNLNDNFREIINENKLLVNETEKIRDFVMTPWLFNKYIVTAPGNDINDATIKQDSKNRQLVLNYLQGNNEVWQAIIKSPKILEDICASLNTNEIVNTRLSY